jgi:hypothetical protein
MKAKEAAEHVNATGVGPDKVIKMIPGYENPLHKRQWISTFLKHLSPGLQPNYRQPLLDSLKP